MTFQGLDFLRWLYWVGGYMSIVMGIAMMIHPKGINCFLGQETQFKDSEQIILNSFTQVMGILSCLLGSLFVSVERVGQRKSQQIVAAGLAGVMAITLTDRLLLLGAWLPAKAGCNVNTFMSWSMSDVTFFVLLAWGAWTSREFYPPRSSQSWAIDGLTAGSHVSMWLSFLSWVFLRFQTSAIMETLGVVGPGMLEKDSTAYWMGYFLLCFIGEVFFYLSKTIGCMVVYDDEALIYMAARAQVIWFGAFAHHSVGLAQGMGQDMRRFLQYRGLVAVFIALLNLIPMYHYDTVISARIFNKKQD